MHKKFVFVKPFTSKDGSFKKGDTITVINDHIFFNDGMVVPSYYWLLFDLVEYELNEGFNYLKEITIPYNKA